MSGYDRDSKVTGKYLLAFVESTGEVSPVFQRKTQNLFEEKIGELDPDEWYNTEIVTSVYEDIRDDVGPNTMRQGGEAVGDAVPYPGELSIEEAIDRLNEEHKQSFRDSSMERPAGKYLVKNQNDRSARMGVDNDYAFPKSLVNGVFTAFIKEHGPSDANPEFDEVEPNGDELFAWEVTW